MYFEICIGTQAFTERPNIRLQQLVGGMLSEFDSNLVKQWDIKANSTSCRVFGDWYWDVPCSNNNIENQQIVNYFNRWAQILYQDGAVRLACIELKTY